MLAVGPGPDSQCGPEQVCSFWGSVSPICEMGPSVRTSHGCGQEGWRPGQCSPGPHQVAGSSLPGPRVHTASARYEQALRSRPSPWYAPPRPPPTAVAVRGPGSRAAPPPAPAPAPASAPRRSPARLPTGVRLQETARSRLSAPATRRAPDDPADSAGPPGGPQRGQRGDRPRVRASDISDGRGGQRGEQPGRPWGPRPGQRSLASGSPESEKPAAGAAGAMTSVWKRLQRVGKRAAKFQFVACYHELVVECTKKW